MSEKIIMLTGGSGFVGQMLQVGLRKRGYAVRLFDQYRGAAITLLRRRHLGTSRSPVGQALARQIGKLQRMVSIRLLGGPLLRPTRDNILDMRSVLAARFRGAYAIVHLAAIPHPFLPGAIDADFQRINYDGSVNVFEAAKSIGVPKFLFASSAQVYGINNPTRIDQFPILESNYCPTLADGQHMYGLLKVKFEQYLAGACAAGGTQGISLRLEYPGFQSTPPATSTSARRWRISSQASSARWRTRPASGSRRSISVDGHVDERIVDVQQFIRTRWPAVPNFSKGNESLISVAKAGALLGYNPIRNGSYVQQSLVW